MAISERRRQFGLSLLVSALMASAPSAIAQELPKVLVMGTYASELPSEELEKLDPLREGLEKRLAALGFPIKIDIVIFPTYEEAVVQVARNKVDFARMGPANYVLVKRQNPGLKLLAMETKGGAKQLTGYISVPENSPVRKLQDLRGRRIAFGEQNSTTGRYFPQAALVEAGIFASDLSGYRFLGRHDKALSALAAGSFDAAASNEVSFEKYGVVRKFRVIHTMKSPAHAWVVRSDLSPLVMEKLRQAMLATTSAELSGLKRDGMSAGSDSEYEQVRQAMKTAVRFIE
ncbi:phosphate/phosphite/phosphonate ABC transporter substrate-binding protein [Azonexus sp. IMCC34839]|uniref:phosphate/phosphite/phosphonate ABC transporter substrate-binding protein n=1 Tax=Azonexus sp. IMCC34839 TaxID=3133695 RepID=UPI00399BDAF4